MNLTLTPSYMSGAVHNLPSAKAVAKNEKAARDFEALLLAPVLEALQKTFAGTSEDSAMPGASDYRLMGTQALAEAMAARGGIGIADMVLRHLSPPEGHGGG